MASSDTPPGVGSPPNDKASYDKVLEELLKVLRKLSPEGFEKATAAMGKRATKDFNKFYDQFKKDRQEDYIFFTNEQAQQAKQSEEIIDIMEGSFRRFDTLTKSLQANTNEYIKFVTFSMMDKGARRAAKEVSQDYNIDLRRMVDKNTGGILKDFFLKDNRLLQMATGHYVGGPGSHSERMVEARENLKEGYDRKYKERQQEDVSEFMAPGSRRVRRKEMEDYQNEILKRAGMGYQGYREAYGMNPGEDRMSPPRDSVITPPPPEVKLLSGKVARPPQPRDPETGRFLSRNKEDSIMSLEPSKEAKRASKIDPTASDVARLPSFAGTPALWLGNLIKKFMKKTEEDNKKLKEAMAMGGKDGGLVGGILETTIGTAIANALKGAIPALLPALVGFLPVLIPAVTAGLMGGGLYLLFKKMAEEPAPGSAPLTQEQKDTYASVRKDADFFAAYPDLSASKNSNPSDVEEREVWAIVKSEQTKADAAKYKEWETKWLAANPKGTYNDAQKVWDAEHPSTTPPTTRRHGGGLAQNEMTATLQKGEVVLSPQQSLQLANNVQRLVEKTSNQSTPQVTTVKLEELMAKNIETQEAIKKLMEENNKQNKEMLKPPDKIRTPLPTPSRAYAPIQ